MDDIKEFITISEKTKFDMFFLIGNADTEFCGYFNEHNEIKQVTESKIPFHCTAQIEKNVFWHSHPYKKGSLSAGDIRFLTCSYVTTQSIIFTYWGIWYTSVEHFISEMPTDVYELLFLYVQRLSIISNEYRTLPSKKIIDKFCLDIKKALPDLNFKIHLEPWKFKYDDEIEEYLEKNTHRMLTRDEQNFLLKETNDKIKDYESKINKVQISNRQIERQTYMNKMKAFTRDIVKSDKYVEGVHSLLKHENISYNPYLTYYGNYLQVLNEMPETMANDVTQDNALKYNKNYKEKAMFDLNQAIVKSIRCSDDMYVNNVLTNVRLFDKEYTRVLTLHKITCMTEYENNNDFYDSIKTAANVSLIYHPNMKQLFSDYFKI